MSRTGDGMCPDVGQWCGIERDSCDGDCMVKRIEDLEAENARLKTALKPVLKCNKWLIGECFHAVSEAQRIYNGGAK